MAAGGIKAREVPEMGLEASKLAGGAFRLPAAMAIQDLKDQMARLPEQPGVYIYYNAHGDTLYVGKARSLRDRTRSYLGAYGMASVRRA